MTLPPRNAGVPCEKVIPMPFSPSCDAPRLQWMRSSDRNRLNLVRAVHAAAQKGTT